MLKLSVLVMWISPPKTSMPLLSIDPPKVVVPFRLNEAPSATVVIPEVVSLLLVCASTLPPLTSKVVALAVPDMISAPASFFNEPRLFVPEIINTPLPFLVKFPLLFASAFLISPLKINSLFSSTSTERAPCCKIICFCSEVPSFRLQSPDKYSVPDHPRAWG